MPTTARTTTVLVRMILPPGHPTPTRSGCIIAIGMPTSRRPGQTRGAAAGTGKRTMALELERWASLAKAHWKEHQPRRYRRLVKAGTLDEEARAAARMTATAMQEWLDLGASRDEAFQAVRERYLFPPEEPGASEEPTTSLLHETMTEFIRTLQENNED